MDSLSDPKSSKESGIIAMKEALSIPETEVPTELNERRKLYLELKATKNILTLKSMVEYAKRESKIDSLA